MQLDKTVLNHLKISEPNLPIHWANLVSIDKETLSYLKITIIFWYVWIFDSAVELHVDAGLNCCFWSAKKWQECVRTKKVGKKRQTKDKLEVIQICNWIIKIFVAFLTTKIHLFFQLSLCCNTNFIFLDIHTQIFAKLHNIPIHQIPLKFLIWKQYVINS